MEIERRLRNERDAAGGHDGKHPGAEVEGLRSGVGKTMGDPDQFVLKKFDFERFLETVRFAGRLDDFDGILAELFPGDGAVVGFVRVIGFGGRPKAVAAAHFPFAFTSATDLFGQFAENVWAVMLGVANDARANVESDDEFGGAALQAQVALPAAVGDFLDHRKGAILTL